MSLSERKQELKRRRHRKKKLKVFERKLSKATVSEKTVIAEKIRRLTPGCEVLIQNWDLEKSGSNSFPCRRGNKYVLAYADVFFNRSMTALRCGELILKILQRSPFALHNGRWVRWTNLAFSSFFCLASISPSRRTASCLFLSTSAPTLIKPAKVDEDFHARKCHVGRLLRRRGFRTKDRARASAIFTNEARMGRKRSAVAASQRTEN